MLSESQPESLKWPFLRVLSKNMAKNPLKPCQIAKISVFFCEIDVAETEHILRNFLDSTNDKARGGLWESPKSPGQSRIQEFSLGGYMHGERVEREPITGVPAGSRGRAPGRGSGGRSPPEAESL